MADQQYEPFSGKLDAAPEFVPFDGTLDGEKPKPRGAIRAMADLGVGVASGVVGVSKAAANVAGAGNTVSNVLDSADKTVQGWLSPQAQADQQEIAAHMSDAKAKGLNLEGVKAGAKAFATAPGQFAAQAVGSAAPFIASALTGPLLPTALGVAVGMGTSKGAIYDEIKKRGGTEEEAIKAQEYGGPNKDQIALGGALGVADALTGVAGAGGRMLRGALRKPVANAAVDAAQPGAIRRMATGVASEAPLEAVQGGQEQVAANMAAQRAGYEAGTWDNVASNATLEALASAGPGAAFGLADKAPAAVKPPVNTVDVGGSAGQGLAGTEPAPTKSQAMGINPAAGPMSAAAAMAVDSGAHETALQQAALAAQDATKDGADKDQSTGPVSNPVTNPVGNTLTPAANVNPATGEIISAFDQREADRPKALPTDILQVDGTPFTNIIQAKKAAREAGEGWAPFKLDKGSFVVRKQEAADAPAQNQSEAAAPAATGATQSSADAVSEGGASADTPKTGALSAKTNPQPTTMGTQRNVNAGPGFSAKDVVKAEPSSPAPSQGQPDQTPTQVEAQSEASAGSDLPNVSAGDREKSPEAPAPASSTQEVQKSSELPSANDTPVTPKAKWLKAINDQNRMAGDTGVQLKVQDGKLTFWGDPRSTKQGRALEATLDEARRAGASTAEIIASISQPVATVATEKPDSTTKTPDSSAETPKSESIQTSAPTTPTAPTPDVGAQDAPAPTGKWFGNAIKAQQYIAKNGLKDTHEAKQNGTRWDVVAKVSSTTEKPSEPEANQTQQATPQREEAAKPSPDEPAAGPGVGDAGEGAAAKPTSLREAIERKQNEPTNHAGLKIYPIKIKVGDKIEQRWGVQTPRNAEREKNGERQIGGDPLSDTLDGAKKLAEQEVATAKDQQERSAAHDANAAAVQAKKDANKGKSLAERKRDFDLDKPTKLHPNAGLGTGTRRESMQKAVDQERHIEAATVRDEAAKKRDTDLVERSHRNNLPTGNINYPGVKEYFEAQARLKADKYEKPEYRIYDGRDRNGSFREITKTEYDYAQELKAQREAAPIKTRAIEVAKREYEKEKNRNLKELRATESAYDILLEDTAEKIDAMAARANGESIADIKKRGEEFGSKTGGSFSLEDYTVALFKKESNAKAALKLLDGVYAEAEQIAADIAKASAEPVQETAKTAQQAEAAPAPVHQDPGEKPESATAPVIAQSIAKAARKEERTQKEMRLWLLDEIDAAVKLTEDYPDYLKRIAESGKEAADSMYFKGKYALGLTTAPGNGMITFDVPGDGKFKVRNSLRGLMEFRAKVDAKSGTGFTDKPTKPKGLPATTGVAKGSSNQIEALSGMLEDLDFEAAVDYARETGISLNDAKISPEVREQFKTYLKDGTEPTPFLPSRYWEYPGQDGADKDGNPIRRATLTKQIGANEYQANVIGTNATGFKYNITKDGKSVHAMLTSNSFANTLKLAEDAINAIQPEVVKPKDTGWNMSGVGFAGKRYRGRNITLDDGREVVARIYENAGQYEDAEVKVDGVSKFSKTDRYKAEKLADDFIRTLMVKQPVNETEKAFEEEKQAKAQEEPGIDLMGFTRTPTGNGAFKLVDGNMMVMVEPTSYGFQAKQGSSAKSGPRLTEQQAIEWAANVRNESKAIQSKEAKPAQVKPDAAASVPKSVQDHVKWALTQLRDIEDALESVRRARGDGHILALEVKDQEAKQVRPNEILDEFREHAKKNGIDAEAVIDALGGVPDLARFSQPASGGNTEASQREFRNPDNLNVLHAPIEDKDWFKLKNGEEWQARQGYSGRGWSLVRNGSLHPEARNFDSQSDFIRSVVDVTSQTQAAGQVAAIDGDLRGYAYALVKNGQIITSGAFPSKANMEADDTANISNFKKEADAKGADIYIGGYPGADAWTSPDGLIFGMTFDELNAKQQKRTVPASLKGKMPTNAVVAYEGQAKPEEANDESIPAVTEAQARKQFEWRNMGQKDGTKTHRLYFAERESDKGTSQAMGYGAVELYPGSSGWKIEDGDGTSYPSLADAKTAAIDAAMPRLRENGYVLKPAQAAADSAPAANADAPYEQLLNLKSTTLLSESNGRKLYDVTVSPAFRNKHFTTGRGTVPIESSPSYELKLKADVTGNPQDNGYILIDRREQNASRQPATQATEILNAANITGKERIDALKDVKSGTITPDELKEAYPSKAPIADFGEKIGGAKKDTWTGFKDKMTAVSDDDIASRKLSEIWPAPDYQKMIDDGMDAKSVALIRSIRDEVPSKPRTGYKLKRWAEQVKEGRALALGILNEKSKGDTLYNELTRIGGKLSSIAGRADLYMAVGHEKSLEGIRLAHHHYSLYRGRENVSLWVVERDAAATAFSNWPQELATGDTKEDAIAAFKARYAELDAIASVRKADYVIFTKSDQKAVFIGKKIGRNVAELAGPFATLKEARDYRAANLKELDAKLEKYKEIPKERRDTNEPRVGEDMRNGLDVTPEMFAESFGFKGVEFGNWVEQKRRQKDLNDAFDALMDMAAILGVPAKAISLNGELGLAFGARGSGGVNPAAAHYESDKIVINLTKREGAGSLGHEWWHALDNYFSRQRGGRTSPYMTTTTDVGLSSRGSNYVAYDGVRKEMIDAFGEVVKSIRLTAMKARSSKMDAKRTKEYWTTGEEMAARAFESYLISKLHDQNASNDYLANVVDQKTWDAMAALGMENEDSYPYPTAGEMPLIRTGFDKFFQTLETKETDKGVAMFSRGAQPNPYAQPFKPTTVANLQKAIRQLTGITGNLPNQLGRVVATTSVDIKPTWEPLIGFGVNLESQDSAGGALAFFDQKSDTVFLLADRIQEGDETAVLAHELMHKHGQPVLGKAGWDRLHAVISTWKDRPSSSEERTIYAYAMRRVEAAGLHLSNQELFPYAVEAAIKMGIQPNALGKQGSIAKWLADVIRSMKAVWEKVTGKPETFKAQDLVNLAFGIAQMENPEMAGVVNFRDTNEPMTNKDVVGNQGGRSADDSTGGVLFTDENENAIVFERDGFRISVNKPGATSYVVLWAKQEVNGKTYWRKAGTLDTNQKTKKVGGVSGEYLGVSSIEIEKAYRGQGLGLEMYRALISQSAPNIKGIISHTPNRVNKQQVPSIYKKLGAFTDGDNQIIPIGKNEPAAPDSGGAPMFSRSVGETLNTAANSVKDMKLPAGYLVGDLINAAPGKVNWWHKTVGTQYNLAQRSAPFKRVFDSVQNFINDVSFYATEAADLAPNILPKLETWKDITKTPLSANDTKAISAPIFEGTLIWARDESGKPVKMTELEGQAAQLTVEQKAQRLMRNQHITEQILKMWQGLPIDQYETIINGKYERDMLKAGIVWTPAELKALFNLTGKQDANGKWDGQIGLYQEFRTATNKSLTNLAVSDMLRYGGDDVSAVRDQALNAKTPEEAANILADHLRELSELIPERETVLMNTANVIIDKGDRAADLMKRGYAPLSRFGQYTLDVVSKEGERVYFGMFENKFDAARMARDMEKQFPGARITRGTVSEQAYKMFAGVSPETLELFGNMLGLEANGDSASAQVFQEYLKLAKSNRSSMKRLIERKGISGFSEDSGRVLAGFVYSNARQTASNLHMGEMTQAAGDNQAFGRNGELQDAAVKLVDYIKNPQEEAQQIRGLLFAQYIGGSVASAMVNLTQPVTMTFPWLSQFGGIRKAATQMAAATKDALKKTTGDKALDAALHRAEEDGTVSPQEVHQLMQQSMGKGALRSGDGTKSGDAMALAQNSLSRISLAWGKLFSVAEQFNRRSTFIAAYRTAVEQGMRDPDAFARRAIAETQGIYNKGNKPAWARGAIGSTLFTFKQFSISYVEMISRMAKSGPEGKKAALLALAVLFLVSGAGGLPGADDLDDLISGALQALGYNFDSKSKRREFFAGIVGEGGAQFLERGLSGLPGVPVDVSGRLGLGNLIPGTGLFTKKTDHTTDVAEIAGPAGDLAKRTFQAAGQMFKGDALGAVESVSPTTIRNVTKAYDMATMGMYRDQSGKKVIDTDTSDWMVKAIGFQPNDVKKVQDAGREVQRMIALNKMRETEIADQWAKGLFEKDPAKVQAARDDLARWNTDNPESPIRISFGQILKRVKAMNQTKEQRLVKTAPKEIRNTVREELAAAR